MVTKSRRVWLRWGILVILVACLYCTRNQTLPAWGRWLDVGEAPRKADYALVLGGNSDTRPFVAAGLYQAGHVNGILIPQVRLSADHEDGISPPETEITRQILIARKIPSDRIIILEGEVNSTFDEARALSHFLNTHPDCTVAIVTNDFHTRRARSVFRSVLGDRANQIYFVSVPTDSISPDDWWKTGGGCITYLNETFKSLYYAVRY